MQLVLESGVELKCDLSTAIPISVPITFDNDRVTAFGIGVPQSISLVGTSNPPYACSRLTIVPHVHGTHIESAKHIGNEAKTTLQIVAQLPPLLPAYLVCVSRPDLSRIEISDLAGLDSNVLACIEALVIRTGWLEGRTKGTAGIVDLTNADPPYVGADAIDWLRQRFTKLRCLLVDLPSVDPEKDGGKLLAHRRFFANPPAWNDNCIVEFCRMTEAAKEGIYLLALNVAAIDSDAIPCRPVLYPAVASPANYAL